MSNPTLDALHKSWPSVPLSQATTLCDSETPEESVSKQHNQNPTSTLPALSYLHEKKTQSAALVEKDSSGCLPPNSSVLQRFRSNDWVIVLVSAYCEYR